MPLIDLIDKNVIKTPLTSTMKYDVIMELLGILDKAGKLENLDKAAEAVFAREDLGSTGLEGGIAVPHAKTTTVKTLTIAIGIAPEGIDFNALDGKPSRLFFLMLAPPDQTGPHIEALSEIAKITQSKSFVEALQRAKTPEAVLDLFQEP
ncbi:MAG: PTS sugar transporter subunit IIA [Spirochaetales bacterium]|nr:PTS sugar transporter subunit IIA [Spirochaetales bacterium]